MSLGQAVDPLSGGCEGDPVTGLTGSDPQCDRQVRLAGARRSQKDDAVFGDDEVEHAEVGADVLANRTLIGEVEILERLVGGKASRLDAPLEATPNTRS